MKEKITLKQVEKDKEYIQNYINEKIKNDGLSDYTIVILETIKVMVSEIGKEGNQ